MSLQPTGYNLPTNANVTVYNHFPYEMQSTPATTESALFWARRSKYPDRKIQNDAYEGFTGRLHEIMHHRSHQDEY